MELQNCAVEACGEALAAVLRNVSGIKSQARETAVINNITIVINVFLLDNKMSSMLSWQYRRKRYRYLERCISFSCWATIGHSPYALCMKVCACACVCVCVCVTPLNYVHRRE